jgi:hypothetical protein
LCSHRNVNFACGLPRCQTIIIMKAAPMKLFRAEALSDKLLRAEPRHGRSTMRFPVNVPFVVDNLWEHLRPDHMPCRRHAVFASPTPALALESASTGGNRGVFEVVVSGPFKVAQLQVKDAKYHQDVKAIIQTLQSAMAERVTDRSSRQAAAALFLPCASKDDWAALAETSPIAAELIETMTARSSFWREASTSLSPHAGEVFFELGEGASYAPRNLLSPECS